MKDKKIKKISVIIPTFNEEFNIKKTLLSIEKQRCNIPYEIYVSDGGSDDSTVKIAKKYANVEIAPEKGKVKQLNYIVSKTSGELLIFLDADTTIPPNYIQKMYDIFTNDKKLFACSARFKYTNGREFSISIGSKKFTFTTFFFHSTGSHIYYVMRYLLGYPELAGCNIVVRRRIFHEVGGFKNPPKGWGVDKTFSDSVIYYIKKVKYGKIKTLTLTNVKTSARKVSVGRGLKKFYQYQNKKKLYADLARKNNLEL